MPYFAGGIDWNPENVLFEGTRPILVDAFNIKGSAIVALLEKGEPVELDEQGVRDFLSIPYHRPHPGKEAKRYQVRNAREFLTRAGVTP